MLQVGTLTALKDFLHAHGISPKKGLSQNFLIDGNIVRKIVKEASTQEGETFLEIGPGPGVITEALISAKAHVIAIEKDIDLAHALSRFPSVEVHAGDALKFPLERLSNKKKMKILSALPYHLTTPIITRYLPRSDLFTSMTVVVQDEMAQRMIATPSTAGYGFFNCFLNFYAHIRYAFFISRSCFYPAPHVDSAVVTLTLRETPQLPSPEAFFQFLRLAFQQKRKMLKKTLGDLYGSQRISEALTDLGLEEKVRPENLSLEMFLALYQKIV